MSYIQPYLQSIVEAVIGILAVFVLAGINAVKQKAETLLEGRTTAQQRETLYGLAQEGMSLAEATYKAEGGPAKLQAAMAYVAKHSAVIGLNVTPETIQAAIEKAVLEYNKNKTAIPAALSEPAAAIEQPEQEATVQPAAEETAVPSPAAAEQADVAPPAFIPVQTASAIPVSEPTAPVLAEDATLHQKLDTVISLLTSSKATTGGAVDAS